jgi:folate-dependent phosphoribosylglycinamide formyltransferase PurN
MRSWVTFFSQTGTDIHNLSKKLGRYPDVIITNNEDINQINPNLLADIPSSTKFIKTTTKPSVNQYLEYIPENAFVTLHGWLRIVPEEICNSYEIYNLHPANLLLHPHLKGKDPQKRAAAELLQWSGNTIHRCTAELDAGEIKEYSTVLIEGLLEFEVIFKLHKDATNLWFNFLNKHLLYL